MEILAQMLSGGPTESNDESKSAQDARQAAVTDSMRSEDQEDKDSSCMIGVKRPLPIGPALPPGVTGALSNSVLLTYPKWPADSLLQLSNKRMKKMKKM